MLKESDFEIIGKCSKCENPIYKNIFSRKDYFSCLCNFTRLKPARLSINSSKNVNENKCSKSCDCKAA